MKVLDAFCEPLPEPFCDVVSIKPDGRPIAERCSMQTEHLASLIVNDALFCELICSADELVDLAVGRLFTEGVIRSVDDVVSVRVSADGARIGIQLAAGVDPRPSRARVEEYVSGAAGFDKLSPVPVSIEQVFSLAKAFAEDTPVHKRTMGSHSCRLATGDEVLCCREDLGRHNAFDKVIGYALRNGVDLEHSLIFSSGRVPAEIVCKAVRARIPTLVTKAIPTEFAVRLARDYGLTLVCSAWPDGMRVFSDPLGCLTDGC
ncbi:MAG: formate dehydrogenase accessory sulfurtransferase FdhD [Coriobacteriales bacterium]